MSREPEIAFDRTMKSPLLIDYQNQKHWNSPIDFENQISENIDIDIERKFDIVPCLPRCRGVRSGGMEIQPINTPLLHISPQN